jgi:hypothetical protein
MSETLRSYLSPIDTQWLKPGEEPAMAAHLITPRRFYTHHGLYVGMGRVIHYAGPAGGFRNATVAEATLDEFSRGQPVGMRVGSVACFAREEIILRARARLGERRYHILRNNCEHFCEWCLRGSSRSPQVECLVKRSGCQPMLHGIHALRACFAAPPPSFG